MSLSTGLVPLVISAVRSARRDGDACRIMTDPDATRNQDSVTELKCLRQTCMARYN